MANPPVRVPTQDLFRLSDRTILVTGGLGGIGKEIVATILECGGKVISFDLATELIPIFKHVSETQLQYRSVDVSSAEAISVALEDAVAKLGTPLRGIITTAGISGEVNAVDYPPEKFRKILEVNVMGTFLCAQAAAQLMHKNNWGGSMVLIASMSGSIANKGLNTTAYNSSKAAVIQMARSLAAEWGSQSGHPVIRVNSLSPGYVVTPLSADSRADPETLKQWVGDNMLGRISMSEEYRAPVLFLLGDGSGFVTGHDLKVDGGHCAW